MVLCHLHCQRQGFSWKSVVFWRKKKLDSTFVDFHDLSIFLRIMIPHIFNGPNGKMFSKRALTKHCHHSSPDTVQSFCPIFEPIKILSITAIHYVFLSLQFKSSQSNSCDWLHHISFTVRTPAWSSAKVTHINQFILHGLYQLRLQWKFNLHTCQHLTMNHTRAGIKSI